MHDDVAEIFLKLSEIQQSVTSGHVETVQRLTGLEIQMTSLLGNGQPGRITKVEDRLTLAEAYVNTEKGKTAARSGIISVIVTLIVSIAVKFGGRFWH